MIIRNMNNRLSDLKLKKRSYMFSLLGVILVLFIVFIIIFYFVYYQSLKRHEKSYIHQQLQYVTSSKKAIEDRLYNFFADQKFFADVTIIEYEKKYSSYSSLKKTLVQKIVSTNEALFFAYFHGNKVNYFPGKSEDNLLKTAKSISKEYYNIIKKTDQFSSRLNFISYFYISSSEQLLFIYMPVFIDHEIKGILCSAINIKPLVLRYVKGLEYDSDIKAFIFSGNGTIIWHSVKDKIGKNIINESSFPQFKNISAKMLFDDDFSSAEYSFMDNSTGLHERRIIVWSHLKISNEKIYIASDASDLEINKTITDMRFNLMLLGLFFTVVLILSTYFLVKYKNKILEDNARELEMQVYLRTEELVMKETLYQTIFESANDGIILLKKYTMVDTNYRAATTLSYKKSELLNIAFEDLSPEVQPNGKLSSSEFHRRIDLTLEGNPQSFEWLFRSKDGHYIDAEIALKNIILSEEDFVMVILRDITSRNLAKKELENTKNYLKQLLDSLSTILISLNKECKITQWNNAAEKYFGIRENIALYNTIWEIIPFFERYKDKIYEVINRHNPRFLTKEVVNYRGKKYFNIFIHPLKFDINSGVVISLDDITEIERKEEQLHQAQKMETVGNLAGGLAHDFNNVLGGIIGTISLIEFNFKHSKEIDSDKLKKQMKTIGDSANRAADMVKQLLSLTRKHELSFRYIDLNTSVNNVYTICKNTFDKKIELQAKYYTEEAITEADPTKIEQVLLNLCVNASHAMTVMRNEIEEQGGVLKIEVNFVDPTSEFLSIYHEAENIKYWSISVSDTGIGMDEETLERIFDPFFTTKGKGKGTGLGLAMVYNIIKQHKGFINVESVLSKGSKFEVFLPAITKVIDKTLILHEKNDDNVYYGNGTILIVDDEEVIRNTAKEILNTCGYEVLIAENGYKAIEIYNDRSNEIKAVLLDMAMPGLSGKDTYIELKKINSNIIVILASGFKQDERVKDVLKLGVSAFIQKPYSLNQLSEVFKKYVQ